MCDQLVVEVEALQRAGEFIRRSVHINQLRWVTGSDMLLDNIRQLLPNLIKQFFCACNTLYH